MKILVAVDPSDAAHLAAAKAAEMAKKEGAELTLIAVAEAFEDLESLFGAQATERLRQRAAQALDAAQALVRAQGLAARELMPTGVSPEDNILEAAEKGGYDLIVMGTRGKKGMGLRLGSVSSRVVAQAPCSVLVVR